MDAFTELKKLSARVGRDPLLVQGPGGNTSIKLHSVMWIKASGTWLSDAEDKEIFVPLDLPRLQAALAAGDERCEACTDFIVHAQNPSGLRPSIETSVHGLMRQKTVVHVHCVNTIALAIRSDGEEECLKRLGGLNAVYIPYARPGLQLARAIAARIRPKTNVLILGNHGLAVAGDTVSEAQATLDDVVKRLATPVREIPPPDLAVLEAFAAGTDYRLPHDPHCHGAALDAIGSQYGLGAVFYPDHVVFLGASLPDKPTPGAAALAFPGKGVLVHREAKPAVEPMLRCLSDVFRRVSAAEKLCALGPSDVAQLLNWDAEKYRQTLTA
jgi:rhamnose utilization protein RhaD (predicted bifunctional aldolase and dehydrogenase)